jgi:1,4-dihydroxy-2-naphthoyl-CoA synthase
MTGTLTPPRSIWRAVRRNSSSSPGATDRRVQPRPARDVHERERARVAERVYTVRVFPAEEALAGGLLSRVVPPDQLLPTALALAHEIADNTSATSVALCRQLLWHMTAADHPMEAHGADSRAIYWIGKPADVREGVAWFLEKRPPRFTMKPRSERPPGWPPWAERKLR